MFFAKLPKISVCIPVYKSEKFLEQCLLSVKMQKTPPNEKNFFEIVIVDDGSPFGAEKIVKEFKKSAKIPVKFLRHNENKGLLEARRTAIYEAKGDYIFILDSDDRLLPDALFNLYECAVHTESDIVQGRVKVSFQDDSAENRAKFSELKKSREYVANNLSEKILNEKEIFDGFLINQNHNGFLWGKLYSRELYLNAFEHIPSASCTLAEDFLQYFWISYEAKRYASLNEEKSAVYEYTLDTGISSQDKICDLEKWEKICSAASVFTSIFGELEEKEIGLTQAEKDALAQLCRNYILNNLRLLKSTVVKEFQPEAYKMLCEYWGESFVKEAESHLQLI